MEKQNKKENDMPTRFVLILESLDFAEELHEACKKKNKKINDVLREIIKKRGPIELELLKKDIEYEEERARLERELEEKQRAKQETK